MFNALDLQFRVSGYDRVARLARELAGGQKYRGYIRDAIVGALQDLTNYAKSIAHKETGLLASAISYEYNTSSMVGRLFISPRYVRASGNRLHFAWIYGSFEHARGGEHAFFERTMNERSAFSVARELNARIRTFDF
jgi:hypothetical protein